MMSLPVPILDDLTWTELVQDARSRIPSNAARWTDHNAHDPGITLLELMAAACEQISYRIDQVPPSHRARFLSLLGVTREPALAATAVLKATAASPVDVGEKWELVAESDGASTSFVVSAGGRAGPTSVIELRVEGAAETTTAPPQQSLEPFGADGASALTLVLSPAAPGGTLALWFASAYDNEMNSAPTACPGDAARRPVRLSWECADANGWRPLPAAAVDDGTLCLRRSGVVALELASAGVTRVRCRVAAGRYDRAPALLAVWCNPVLVRAAVPGVDGNPPAHPQWRVERPVPAPSSLVLSAPLGVRDGRDAESLDEALGRAAVRLSAHERLVDLMAAYGVEFLGQVPRTQLLAAAVPARAVTLPDLERVAFATPGTELARVRALADVDLDVRCASAPGTVSVTIVPFLPVGRPEPTPELIACVARQLARHKTLGTRIRLSGPTYTTVDVAASVVVTRGTDPDKTRTSVERAIRTFLDPLIGGPDGRGWPFGRDVYRTEVMTVVGGVPGVELVADVSVVTDRCDACPNACVPDGALVTLGSLDVEVS
jgi:hypothetical protein